MNKKITLFSLLISFILTAAGLGISFYFLSNINYIDRAGVYLGNFQGTQKISWQRGEKIIFNQEIISRQENLAKIIIPLKSSRPIKLSLILKNANSGKIIRKNSFIINKIKDYRQTLEWNFKPIHNSQNQKYLLEVSGQVEQGTFTLFTVPPNHYDGGPLYINHQKQPDKRIVIDWQYYTNQPLTVLSSRLGYAKPGIFNNYLFSIILFIILIIISLTVIWRLILLFTKKWEK